ncbi:MAG TPA: NrsF family protein [Vicinamibacterales bacterium]|nr:NrsF family protein [Vicinamibacterales bacterium]
MKQDELIETLVDDLRRVQNRPRTGRSLATFLLWSAGSALVFTRGGTSISDAPGGAALSLFVILMTAAAAAIVSSIPGRQAWRVGGVLSLVLLLVWGGGAAIRAVSVWHVPFALWGPVPWTKCLIFTLAFAVVPTLALIRIVNRGWVVQAGMTAVLTFTAGAAAGALTISLECPSHAPLHLLLGHMLPIVCAALIGLLFARLLFVRPLVPPLAT